MEDIEKKIQILRNQELKVLWENKACAFNSIFDYLKKRGLKERELDKFAGLLSDYIQFI